MILKEPYRVKLSTDYLRSVFGENFFVKSYHLGQIRGSVVFIWKEMGWVEWDSGRLPNWQRLMNLERVEK